MNGWMNEWAGKFSFGGFMVFFVRGRGSDGGMEEWREGLRSRSWLRKKRRRRCCFCESLDPFFHVSNHKVGVFFLSALLACSISCRMSSEFFVFGWGLGGWMVSNEKFGFGFLWLLKKKLNLCLLHRLHDLASWLRNYIPMQVPFLLLRFDGVQYSTVHLH